MIVNLKTEIAPLGTNAIGDVFAVRHLSSIHSRMPAGAVSFVCNSATQCSTDIADVRRWPVQSLTLPSTHRQSMQA